MRCAAVDALDLILRENPLAHPALQQLLTFSLAEPGGAALTCAGAWLFDRSESVRRSAIALLRSVQKVRGIRFYDAVSVDQLLLKLASDYRAGRAVGPLSRLLLNSFFPAQRGDLQLERCVAFLQRNAEAAMAFYSALRLHVSVGAVTKLLVMIVDAVDAALQEEGARRRARLSERKRAGAAAKKRRPDPAEKNFPNPSGDNVENPENSENSPNPSAAAAEEDAFLLAEDTGLVCGLLGVCAALLESIEEDLEDGLHESAVAMLCAAASAPALTRLYYRYASHPACRCALLKLAALLPSSHALRGPRARPMVPEGGGGPSPYADALLAASGAEGPRREGDLLSAAHLEVLCSFGLEVYLLDAANRATRSFFCLPASGGAEKIPKIPEKRARANEGAPEMRGVLRALRLFLGGGSEHVSAARQRLLSHGGATEQLLCTLRLFRMAAERVSRGDAVPFGVADLRALVRDGLSTLQLLELLAGGGSWDASESWDEDPPMAGARLFLDTLLGPVGDGLAGLSPAQHAAFPISAAFRKAEKRARAAKGQSALEALAGQNAENSEISEAAPGEPRRPEDAEEDAYRASPALRFQIAVEAAAAVLQGLADAMAARLTGADGGLGPGGLEACARDIRRAVADACASCGSALAAAYLLDQWLEPLAKLAYHALARDLDSSAAGNFALAIAAAARAAAASKAAAKRSERRRVDALLGKAAERLGTLLEAGRRLGQPARGQDTDGAARPSDSLFEAAALLYSALPAGGEAAPKEGRTLKERKNRDPRNEEKGRDGKRKEKGGEKERPEKHFFAEDAHEAMAGAQVALADAVCGAGARGRGFAPLFIVQSCSIAQMADGGARLLGLAPLLCACRYLCQSSGDTGHWAGASAEDRALWRDAADAAKMLAETLRGGEVEAPEETAALDAEMECYRALSFLEEGERLLLREAGGAL